MHITSVEHHMMGSYAIVGAHLPIAAGAAWSAQYRKSGQVAVCFFGDGTTNIGAFHEALNMAVVWKAPVVFVCENNQYMEYTPIAEVTAVPRPAADRASAYGLEPIVVDGNDAEAVFEATRVARERALAGDGPTLIEAVTMRMHGHAAHDDMKYVPKEQLEEWRRKDPIDRQVARVAELGIDVDALRAEVKEVIDAGTEEALAMPMPDPATATDGVFAEEANELEDGQAPWSGWRR